jgi:acyl-CoA synthetase (AMP-forming)/AMP-acid ligase II
MVQFSSGTTSSATTSSGACAATGDDADLAELPKPIGLSHRAVLMQAHMLGGHFPERRDFSPSGVSWLPLYHDMGLIGCVFTALSRPANLTLLPPEVFLARPALWLRAISTYRGTVSPAPNFAYSLCIERIKDEEMQGVDLSSWRVALNGAESVTPEVLERFTERFSRWGFRREAFTPVYGLAEAALAVTFSSLDQVPRVETFDATELSQGRASLAEGSDAGAAVVELVSVGRPVPGFELEIRQSDRQVVADGVVGRVWVRGPSLMSRYLGRPAATAEVLHDGWLDTGDEGFIFERDLFLTGRAKDVVLLRGRNHSPDWIERSLDGIDALRTGCAVAVSHRETNASSEALWLFAERARGKSGTDDQAATEAVRHAVLGRTGLLPDRVVLLAPGTLPRTSSGKLRRRETLRRFLADELEPPDRMGPLPLARALLRSRQALQRLNRNRQDRS